MKTILYITCFLLLILPTLVAQTIVSLPDNRLALTLQSETNKFYSIRQSTQLEGISESAILATAEGTGADLGPFLPLDPSIVSRGFYHLTEEILTARPTTSGNLFANSTLLGINLLPNNRWNFFGITGDFSYEVTSAQEGTLLFTLDEFGNDPNEGVITAELDFGDDGDLTTVVGDFDYFSDGTSGAGQETQTLDLTQNSLAPGVLLFDLLAGGPYLNFDFTSRSRFVFDGDEPGNYTVSRPNDDQVLLTFTFDEDGNNPAIYREEVTVTFNGTATVPVFVEIYEGNSLTVSQSAGTIQLTPD